MPARLLVLGWVCACGGAGHTDRLVLPEGARVVDGLGSCGTAGEVELDTRPIVILVHGNRSARERFGPLAAVLENHGMQALCFRWVERGRLTHAARALAEAVRALGDRERILVLGHSLGGLAARRALTRELLPSLAARVDLVTVATPFAGVRAARACGVLWQRVLSMGAVSTICRRITRGSKWRDIHPTAGLITSPGTLGPYVERHLHVVTDERESCRRRRADGRCAKSDFVFSQAEQSARRVRDARVRRAVVRAGHGQVVGGTTHSGPLIRALQREALLAETPDGS